MEIAISNKDDTGKALLTAPLSQALAEPRHSTITLTVEPDDNPAATLGFTHPRTITLTSEMQALTAERTGTEPGKTAAFFSSTPK